MLLLILSAFSFNIIFFLTIIKFYNTQWTHFIPPGLPHPPPSSYGRFLFMVRCMMASQYFSIFKFKMLKKFKLLENVVTFLNRNFITWASTPGTDVSFIPPDTRRKKSLSGIFEVQLLIVFKVKIKNTAYKIISYYN